MNHYRRLLTYRQILDEEEQHKSNVGIFLVIACLGALLIAGCVLTGNAHAYTDIQVVEAIKKAENSKKYPYGIKSVKVHSEAHARQICLNSVRNAHKRWVKAGKPGDFIEFMGKRYSPPSINPNWVRLVKHFLNKAGA